MGAVVWHGNGLGEPLCTDWLPMDAPIGPALAEAGPQGWTEFGPDGVRLWRPFDWSVG